MVRNLWLLLLLVPSLAMAGLLAPSSGVTFSADGSRMLVMLSPAPERDHHPTAQLPDGREIKLHEQFTQSGVYEVATLEPVWQVDWYSHLKDLRWSDDLKYVVDLNRHGFDSAWGLQFYDAGKLIREYDCQLLITRWKHSCFFDFTSSDWHLVWYGDFKLSAERDQVLFSTARRQVYVAGVVVDLGWQELYAFDLATGEMVSQQGAGGWIVSAYASSAVIAILALLLFLRWLWLRITRSHDS